MVAEGLEAAEQVVQPVSRHAERSIAAVAAELPQRRAPEVILEEARPRCARLQVRVRQYRPSGRFNGIWLGWLSRGFWLAFLAKCLL